MLEIAISITERQRACKFCSLRSRREASEFVYQRGQETGVHAHDRKDAEVVGERTCLGLGVLENYGPGVREGHHHGEHAVVTDGIHRTDPV